MRQRVTVVLVARNGGEALERTITALKAQTHLPDALIAIDAGSRDASESVLAAAEPTRLMALPSRMPQTFGSAVAHAVKEYEAQDPTAGDHDAEWLWLLAHDSVPHRRALERLVSAVEIAPSVAIAGPKIMSLQRPDVIVDFGQSMTALGASFSLVQGELDQAQHDVSEDVLGVAATGMLVRRAVFEQLGGFDPGLPVNDSGLDLCVRARLAGHRVVVVPAAKVSSSGQPGDLDGVEPSDARQARMTRSAQLHRRLVYAPAFAVPLHWLSLLPLALIRMFWHLLAKRPGRIPGEFVAAVSAAFDGTVLKARRTLARRKQLGWSAIAPLRVTIAEVRERRGQAREAFSATGVSVQEPKISYLGGGGLWVAVFAAIAGIIMFGPLLGASAVAGGALLPLSSTVADLWAQVGVGWREIGTGFVGSADPFAIVLAMLGSLTFWDPSLSIIVLHLLALPLASATAWFAARRMTRSPWLPLIAAVLWAVAPPFIASLTSGHLGAVIAHILLPALVVALTKAGRSISSAAAASILFALIAASAPVLVPALLVGWIACMVANPRGIGRLIGVPVLAAVLFAPLVFEQIMRGTPLALLADPGAPTVAGATSGWHLALVSASEGLNGWTEAASALSLPGISAHVIVAVLLAPLAILALVSLLLPGTRRSVPALAVALLGFATAVAGSRIAVTVLGDTAVPIWPGSGLSLFWLGLVGAAVVALEGLGVADRRGRLAVVSGVVASVAALALAMPLMLSMHLGTAQIHASDGRLVPAVVDAAARTSPRIGTVVLTPTADGALLATLQRGTGATLDAQSTLAATSLALSPEQEALAHLAGNMASRGDYDPRQDLEDLAIGFVVLAEGPDVHGARVVAKRTTDSLDASANVTAVGQTGVGLLWRVSDAAEFGLEAPAGNTDTTEGRVVLGVQAGVALVVLLLAVPTQRRRKPRMQTLGEGPATTFDEDLDD